MTPYRRERWRLVDGLLVVGALAGLGKLGHSRLLPAETVTESHVEREVRNLLGESLSPIPAVPFDSAGNPVIIKPAGNTLIFFFQSECPYCAETIPAWEQLARGLDRDVKVLALTPEKASIGKAWADEYLPGRAKGYSVDSPPWGIPLVPATLFLDSTRRVTWARLGRLTPVDVGSLLSLRERPFSEPEKED